MLVLGSLPPKAQLLILLAHLLPPVFPLCPTNSGLRDGRALMTHFTTPDRVAPWHPLQSPALQSCLSPLPPGIMQQSQALSASQQSFSNFFVIFSLALFMKVVCQNTVPLIATPFLSVLFPVRCFALTHQVKTQNMRWEHLALAVEPCQGEKFLDIRSAFSTLFTGPFCGMFRASCRSPQGGQQPPACASLSPTQLQSANV